MRRIGRDLRHPSFLLSRRHPRTSLVVLEVLHRFLVRLGCMSRGKCTEVFALAGFSVFFA
jgi:hypothetical protein